LKTPRRILYVTHRASSSPEEEWCAWLSAQGAEVFLLGHPFAYKKPNQSHLVLYRGGRLVRRIGLGFHLPWAPAPLLYIRDALLNFLVPLFLAFRPVDLCISADPLNTGSLLSWRRLGFLKRIVHYTIDYAPRRFKNRLMNSFYHFLDRRACYGSDAIWVLTDRMMRSRFSNGVKPSRCAPSVVVPMGADLSRIEVPEVPPEPRRLVYMGTLRENQGLELCAEVFAELRRDLPDLTWHVVGEGFLRPLLEERLKILGVAEGVVWHGFQKDHRDVERILARGGIGMALYEPSESTYTDVADPGKPKVYLACGLPVLITSVPAVAEEIARVGAGRVVPFEKKAAVETLREWLADPAGQAARRKAALELARSYDWKNLFERAWKDTRALFDREERVP